MSELVPCGACARHVKASEEECPFCKARVVRHALAKRAPYTRDRAALLFGAATLAGAMTACTAAYGGPPPEIRDRDRQRAQADAEAWVVHVPPVPEAGATADAAPPSPARLDAGASSTTKR